MEIIIALSLFFAAAIIFTVLITKHIFAQSNWVGNLIISNDPEEEFMSLELKKNPNELLNKRFIVLQVKEKN